MPIAHKLLGTAVGLGLMAGSITPAQARPGWHDGGWHDRGWRRNRGDGFGLGDAIGIAAIMGAVAVVANSVSKDRAVSEPRYPDRYPEPAEEPRYEGADTSLVKEDHAVNDCASAAREEATVSGGYAEIRNIGVPQPIEGGYNIDGEVERRGSYRDAAGETRRFTCTVHGDKVTDVYLSRDLVSD